MAKLKRQHAHGNIVKTNFPLDKTKETMPTNIYEAISMQPRGQRIIASQIALFCEKLSASDWTWILEYLLTVVEGISSHPSRKPP